VRALFVSDVHLGCRHSQADPFLELLQRYEPEQLYLVGDFIDGWKLKRRWRWTATYDQILRRLMTLRRAGTQLFYTPGNHDAFLRGYLADYGVVEICDRFVHTAADGRRYLVTHGDQFDRVEKRAPWLSFTASYAYDLLLSTNKFVNRLRGKKRNPYALCGAIKRRVKRVVTQVSEFEDLISRSAGKEECDGIICGHIHTPRIAQVGKLIYCNTGDWVENCSALIEYGDGGLELVDQQGRALDRLAAMARGSAPRPAEPPAPVGQRLSATDATPRVSKTADVAQAAPPPKMQRLDRQIASHTRDGNYVA